jgi:hypothetical protein
MISDVLSIAAMSNIFKECDKKLSYAAKQLYQNILQHHFSTQVETVASLSEFHLKYNEIPNYEKFSKPLTELDVAKLIELKRDSILFFDVWTKHIQIGRFTEYSSSKLASEFKDEMQNSRQLLDAVGMKTRINPQEVLQLLESFVTEQDGIDKKYHNEQECRKHFLYWSLRNADKADKKKVTSNAKILGK